MLKINSNITLADVYAYLTGKYRYKIWYSNLKTVLIRKHIREQIEFRVRFMNNVCYEFGECVVCGCQTIALQMAAKPCEGKCYPKMVGSDKWLRFKNGMDSIEDCHGIWTYNVKKDTMLLCNHLLNHELQVTKEVIPFKPLNYVRSI